MCVRGPVWSGCLLLLLWVVGTWIGACVGSGSSSRVRSVRGGSGRYVEGPVRYGTVRRRRRRRGYGGTGIHACAESGSC